MTFNFDGTSQSEVQSNNRLMAGIFDTVFSATITGLDYGYRAVVALPGSGSMYLIAQVDEYCEGFIFTSCGVTPWSKTIYAVTPSPAMSTSDNIQLYLEFSGSTAYWVYKINGGSATIFGEFTPPSDSQSVFQVGTNTAFNGHVSKYFQFGIDSDYNIGHSGWYVDVDKPEYATAWGNPYVLVPQANLAQGGDAFLDARWVWGGQDYSGVNACYPDSNGCSYPPYEILFFYTGTTISDPTLLWG